MNGRCESCDVEQECCYPYKPTDCCNKRKFKYDGRTKQSKATSEGMKLYWAKRKRDEESSKKAKEV